MTDIQKLIQLNLELEGLLRILADRDDAQARSIFADKVQQYFTDAGNYLAACKAGAQPDIMKNPASVAPSDNDSHIEEIKEEEAEEAEVEPEARAAEEAVVEGRNKAVKLRSLRKAFSLNDKFYFVREVFGGDERDFNDTVALLDDMESYVDAEEYLISDMMLDAENSDVKAFLRIVASCFA